MSIYKSLKTGLEQAINGEVRKVDIVEVVYCKDCEYFKEIDPCFGECLRKEGTIKFFETERFNRVYELAIIELPEMYEAWLTRRGYGVAEFLLGCKKEQTIYGKPYTFSWDEFADMAIDYASQRLEDASKLVHIDDEDE